MATVDRFFKQGQKDFFRTTKTKGRIHERTNPDRVRAFRVKYYVDLITATLKI